MISLLNTSNFFTQYGFLILLVVALGVLIFLSYSRKKKEDTYREELSKSITLGAKIKTYYGVYGKVIKITETTDGKILLIETGEGKNVSYQSVHFNAIYGIDQKEEVTLDAEGNIVDKSEKQTKSVEKAEKELVELEKALGDKTESKTKTSTAKKTSTKTTTKK